LAPPKKIRSTRTTVIDSEPQPIGDGGTSPLEAPDDAAEKVADEQNDYTTTPARNDGAPAVASADQYAAYQTYHERGRIYILAQEAHKTRDPETVAYFNAMLENLTFGFDTYLTGGPDWVKESFGAGPPKWPREPAYEPNLDWLLGLVMQEMMDTAGAHRRLYEEGGPDGEWAHNPAAAGQILLTTLEALRDPDLVGVGHGYHLTFALMVADRLIADAGLGLIGRSGLQALEAMLPEGSPQRTAVTAELQGRPPLAYLEGTFPAGGSFSVYGDGVSGHSAQKAFDAIQDLVARHPVMGTILSGLELVIAPLGQFLNHQEPFFMANVVTMSGDRLLSLLEVDGAKTRNLFPVAALTILPTNDFQAPGEAIMPGNERMIVLHEESLLNEEWWPGLDLETRTALRERDPSEPMWTLHYEVANFARNLLFGRGAAEVPGMAALLPGQDLAGLSGEEAIELAFGQRTEEQRNVAGFTPRSSTFQVWFSAASAAFFMGGEKRAWLEATDPEMHQFLATLYGEGAQEK
jgi:hypothetical protein